MNNQKGFVPIILLLAVILTAGGIFLLLNLNLNQKNNSYIAPTAMPYTQTPNPSSTNQETIFPPLYPNVQWGDIQQGEYFFRIKDLKDISKEGYYLETTQAYPITEVVNFLQYYRNKLEANGWELTGQAGGGMDEVDDYQNGINYFEVRSK